MDEIKVGEYIRTEGIICKVLETKGDSFIITDVVRGYLIGRCKSSKNIIDLIEVGDYINGERITHIGKTKTGRTQIITEDSTDFFLKYEYIETILTHEQYEQNCYKAGED